MNGMKPRRREFLGLVSGVAVASALPGRVLAAPYSASSPLTFGFDKSTSWGAIGMIAEAEKSFQKAGAKVNVFTFASGKATRNAMISGRINIGVLGGTPFIVGAAKGNLAAIGVAMYAGKTDSVVAAEKSGIKSIKDLKGRKVASQLGSETDYVFQNKILPKYGLSKSDVQIINTRFSNQIAALASGSVDAFAGVEPFPSMAQVDGLGYVLVDYSGFDILPVFLAADRSVAEREPEAVVAFLRGWLAAVKVFKDDRAKAVQIVGSYFKSQGFKISDKVVTLMLSKLDVNPSYVSDLPAYLNNQSKVLFDQHKIGNLPDWNKLLIRTLLKQAMNT